ncbi:MAG: hypothetical protein RL227_2682, partial [Pseudomonadota bacterium]
MTDLTEQSPPLPTPALPEGAVVLLPMRNLVLFPHLLVPVVLGRARSLAALAHATMQKAPVCIVLQKDADDDDPELDKLCNVATLALVVQQKATDDGQVHAVCQGLRRVRLLEAVEARPYLAARFEVLEEVDTQSTRAEALALQLRERGMEILSLMPGVPTELAHVLQATRSPSQLADLAASLIDAEPAEKQQLLETLSAEQRLEKVLDIVNHRLQVLRLSQEIGARTKEQLDDRQRRALLLEQMQTIKKALGENGEEAAEIAGLDSAITAAQMPPDVASHVRKELRRLERMHDAAGEGPPLRTWIDWMTELPWAEPA